jgi:hypothetical protein
MSLHLLHLLNKKETTATTDKLIQNLFTFFDNADTEAKCVLLDSAGNTNVLGAMQTLQQHFPKLIFSKIDAQSEIHAIAQDLGAQSSLFITNENILKKEEIVLAQQKLKQELKKNIYHTYNHKEIALQAEKSLWKKLLLYWQYES